MLIPGYSCEVASRRQLYNIFSSSLFLYGFFTRFICGWVGGGRNYSQIQVHRKRPIIYLAWFLIMEVNSRITKFTSDVFIALLNYKCRLKFIWITCDIYVKRWWEKAGSGLMFSEILKSRANFLAKNLICISVFSSVSRLAVLSVIECHFIFVLYFWN
jgi:hypothetical protein